VSALRFVAPAGSPIRLADLLAGARELVRRGDATDRLCDEVRRQFGVRHAFRTCTGRAGLTVILRALRRLSGEGRDEVILPAYTCYSVAASVVRAGLRPRLVDVDPDTLDLSHDSLQRTDFSRAVALVATSLFGLPMRLPRLTAVAAQHGVRVVDDAAQAMGASIDGRPCGTWGDAGLYSFDKGKTLSAIDGGVLVTQDGQVAGAIRAELESLPATGGATVAVDLVKLLAYVVLLRPSLYWIPNGIPQLGLGVTRYTTDFAIAHYNQALAALALTMLPQLSTFNAHRARTAQRLTDSLRGAPGVRVVEPVEGASAAFLRLPLIVDDPSTRDEILTALNQGGFGATGSYPASLADVPELQSVLAGTPAAARGGRYVAERMLTLPTHPFVSADDVSRMTAIIRRQVEPQVFSASPRAIS
jgi:dTDP-4-amino-4,6-dideoxygalactose transaminase